VTRPGAGTAICLSALSLSAVAPSLAVTEEAVRFDAVAPGEPAQA
jgi:hypothetical protein